MDPNPKRKPITYTQLIRDNKFVIYLGAGAQMMLIDQRRAIYLGGLGINYKTQVVNFKHKARETEIEMNEGELVVAPMKMN